MAVQLASVEGSTLETSQLITVFAESCEDRDGLAPVGEIQKRYLVGQLSVAYGWLIASFLLGQASMVVTNVQLSFMRFSTSETWPMTFTVTMAGEVPFFPLFPKHPQNSRGEAS